MPPILLRPTLPSDLPTLFQIQRDPEGNTLAGTIPRDEATFNARWVEIFANPAITARTIIENDAIVGSINAFQQEGTDSIGYWLAREHWGKRIATRAIALLLDEVKTRPLFARVAVPNTASRRALERNGFAIISRKHRPDTERYLACEELTLRLE